MSVKMAGRGLGLQDDEKPALRLLGLALIVSAAVLAIVRDEATSALDPRSQDDLMQVLAAEVQPITIVSVGHRPELQAFHDRRVVLERRPGGARFVIDIDLAQPTKRQRKLRNWLRRRRAQASSERDAVSG